MENTDQNTISYKLKSPPSNFTIYLLFALLIFISFLAFFVSDYNYVLSLSLLFLSIFTLASLLNLQLGWFIILFLTPFSLEVFIPQFSFAAQFPTEPLIVAVVVIWVLKVFLNEKITYRPFPFDKPLLIFFLFCMLSLAKSAYLLYSVKGLIILFLYIVIGYYFPLHNFNSKKAIKRVVYLLIFLSALFSLIGIFNHFFLEISSFESYTKGVPRPFFPEHGSYAAFITFGFALSLYLGSGAKKIPYPWLLRLSALIIFTGIVLSFTRAAWVGTFLLLLFTFLSGLIRKFSFKNFIILFLVLIVFSFIIYLLALNTDIGKHYFSIYKIRNLSNLERINRWMAAVKMFKQSPLIGIGFDTYINNYYYYRDLVYATAFSSSFMGVHSEYLKVLSETGLLGFSAFIFLLATFFKTGFSLYSKTRDLFLKLTLLGVMGGFFSYLIQGLFNNFTKYDKVAIPFWLSFGLIGAIGRVIQEQKD